MLPSYRCSQLLVSIVHFFPFELIFVHVWDFGTTKVTRYTFVTNLFVFASLQVKIKKVPHLLPH